MGNPEQKWMSTRGTPMTLETSICLTVDSHGEEIFSNFQGDNFRRDGGLGWGVYLLIWEFPKNFGDQNSWMI